MIYRKVYTKDRLPKSEMKFHNTNCGKLLFNGDWHIGIPQSVEYWFEEIELPIDKKFTLEDMRKGLEWAIIEASINGNANYDKRENWINEYLKNHPSLK